MNGRQKALSGGLAAGSAAVGLTFGMAGIALGTQAAKRYNQLGEIA